MDSLTPEQPIERPAPLTSTELALISPRTDEVDPGVSEEGSERDCIPQGEQDHALTALAGFVRTHGRWRLSEYGIDHLLRAVCSNGTLEQDPRRPYTERDSARIARSIARHPVGTPSYEVQVGQAWRSHPFTTPRRERVSRWLLPGFIPLGVFMTMYGEGGIGKTTFAAWLIAGITRQGYNVGVVACEDDPERFGAQVRACGGDSTRLYAPERSLDLQLPRSAPVIREAIEEHNLRMLYFDSLYDHFSHADSENAAERTRRALSPLSEIAVQTRCTIFGNFHTNKSGEYLGSTEVRSISRVMLHASRTRPEHPLTIAVVKTNYRRPAGRLAFGMNSVPYVDADGEPYYEEDAQGNQTVESIGIVTQQEDRPDTVTTQDLSEGSSVQSTDSTHRILGFCD